MPDFARPCRLNGITKFRDEGPQIGYAKPGTPSTSSCSVARFTQFQFAGEPLGQSVA
jgi:hypothetical protein